MHRAADDADIIDGIRQPRLRRNLLSHSRINLRMAFLRPSARGIALRVLSPEPSCRQNRGDSRNKRLYIDSTTSRACRDSAGIDCWDVSLRPREPSCGKLANASVFGTRSTLRVVHFDDTNLIRGPHRAVGSSPRREESLRLRTHSWSMLGEIRLDPSPQPAKNG
jgi:hypothetical protein